MPSGVTGAVSPTCPSVRAVLTPARPRVCTRPLLDALYSWGLCLTGGAPFLWVTGPTYGGRACDLHKVTRCSYLPGVAVQTVVSWKTFITPLSRGRKSLIQSFADVPAQGTPGCP